MDKEPILHEIKNKQTPTNVFINIEDKKETTYFDQYGIERLNNEKTYPKQMKFHFATVIENPIFHPFFKINKEEANRILKVCNFFKMSFYGIQKELPNSDDLQLYERILNKYLSCPSSSPHFVIPQEDGTFIFCIEYKKAKRAIKLQDKYFILKEIEKVDNLLEDRIRKINEIDYFPETSLYEINGNQFIIREFIPKLWDLEQWLDVSDFVEKCKSINFGPDTNVTNFVKYKGKIFYIDQDYIDWIIKPEKHKYDEKKHYLKKKIW